VSQPEKSFAYPSKEIEKSSRRGIVRERARENFMGKRGRKTEKEALHF